MGRKKQKARGLPPLTEFDFRMVQRPLEGLLLNVDRDLQRLVDKNAYGGGALASRPLIIMDAAVRVAQNSYLSVCYLTADSPEDSARKPNYVLIVPTINRQLLDLLTSLVYMLDDFPARVLQYERAGWREKYEEYKRFEEKFAKDPEWRDFFKVRKKGLDTTGLVLGISDKEQKSPSLIQRWWTPSQLKDEPTKSRQFLRWLYKWLYEDTSEQAHLSSSGMVMVAPFLLAEIAGGQDQELVESRIIKQYHFIHVSRTAFTTLAIATEISTFFKLDNGSQIGYLWRVFAEHSDEAKEMLAQRYEGMLA